MTDDINTLRPEVADAVSALDETTCMTNPGLKWYATIRAELLRLVAENHELRAGREQARNDRVDEIRQRVDAEAELAALKARIAGSCRADGQRVFDLLGLPIEFDGTLALVKVEE